MDVSASSCKQVAAALAYTHHRQGQSVSAATPTTRRKEKKKQDGAHAQRLIAPGSNSLQGPPSQPERRDLEKNAAPKNMSRLQNRFLSRCPKNLQSLDGRLSHQRVALFPGAYEPKQRYTLPGIIAEVDGMAPWMNMKSSVKWVVFHDSRMCRWSPFPVQREIPVFRSLEISGVSRP